MKAGYDYVIAGGGVIGASIASHLSELSDASVALFDRGEVCSGGTGRSCAIIRSHYSVRSNTALTLRSLDVFRDFRGALGEDDVDCGFVNSGYLILAGPGPFAESLADNLAAQRALGMLPPPRLTELPNTTRPPSPAITVTGSPCEPRSSHGRSAEKRPTNNTTVPTCPIALS